MVIYDMDYTRFAFVPKFTQYTDNYNPFNARRVTLEYMV